MFLVLGSTCMCNFVEMSIYGFFFFFSGGLVLTSASGGSAPYTLSPQDQIDFGDYMGMSCYISNKKDHVW